jgi:uncharacterized protein
VHQLFTIATDRARLTWSAVQTKVALAGSGARSAHGRLELRLLRRGARFERDTWRSEPNAAVANAELQAGPPLFEQCEYRVALRAIGAREVTIDHRDPLILNQFEDDERGRFDALVNFRSQIGISTFRVLVDGQPEFEFDVEVFPTKVDYRTDYDEILSEVQDTLAGLALEYLRATWHGAETVAAPEPTQIEWLTLLRAVVDELERALLHIASRPVRALGRTEVIRRADQVRRVDGGIRSFLRRQARQGQVGGGAGAFAIPERIAERRPQPTLDTAEHRWLALQVDRIRRRLAELLLIEQERLATRPTERGSRVVAELRQLEARANRWSRLEPLAAATDMPPPGFASLQLLSAPGYREAYRACMTLSLGLRLEGGPLQLSVKDLSLLYEYWCFLALLRILADETGAAIDARRLLEVRSRGLAVLLRQGSESKVPFRLSDGRRLLVRYNPSLGADALVPQRPDMLLTLEQPDWPAVHLVLDAKYRLDASPEYVARYGTPGPPEDSLNAMHRYRDAILDEVGGATRRTVVQAAALFPLRVAPEEYDAGRLWRALRRIGVGAIPLLPGHEQFLRGWLRQWLTHGGWSVADEAIDHAAIHQARAWRQAAAEPVLVGALRGDDPAGHLAWIRERHLYYTPLAKEQRRLFAATEVVFYEPARAREDGSAGAVHFGAKVLNLRVVSRRDISTPWPARNLDEDQVVYELGPLRALPSPIVNKDARGRGGRMGVRRWSSRLALERARTMPELFLETEPEWRLYEDLRAKQIGFKLRTEAADLRREDDLRGRVHFMMDDGRTLTWSGAAGFVVREPTGRDTTVGTVREVMDILERAAL